MRTRDAASAVCGAAALATAVLAVGGAPRWAQAAVAILLAAALVPIALARRRLARVSPLIAVLGIAAALTAIQLLPMPSAIVELLAPTGAALRADGAALAGVH